VFNNQINLNTEQIKAIIFDFDGVILDSVNVKTEAFRELFSDYSLEIRNKIVEHHEKNGGMSRFEKIRFYYDSIIKKTISEEEYQNRVNKFGEIVFNKVLNSEFMDGCIEFLKKHKTHFQYFIVSATPENELNKIISHKGIGHYFTKTYGSPVSKQENIINLLSTYKLEHTEAIYIGDSLNDFEACIKTKLLFVGVTY